MLEVRNGGNDRVLLINRQVDPPLPDLVGVLDFPSHGPSIMKGLYWMEVVAIDWSVDWTRFTDTANVRSATPPTEDRAVSTMQIPADVATCIRQRAERGEPM